MKTMSDEKFKSLLKYEKELSRRDALYLAKTTIQTLIDKSNVNIKCYCKKYLDID